MAVKYGSKNHSWSPEFISYMDLIVKNANYAEMPDAIAEDTDKIQWEAPSNRKSGKYKDTNVKRLNWWKAKASEHGIKVGSEHWISKVAKLIHPTGEKPCKKCGNSMLISYVYPQNKLLTKINSIDIIQDRFEFEDFIPITDIVNSLHEKHGDAILEPLAKVIRSSSLSYTDSKITLVSFNNWLNDFIKSEPRGCLSPGVMSNAPDRFDGFHSFNLCCRSKADTGRTKKNLQSYTTDRRVFENWNQGDWIAADRMMGVVKKSLRQELCKFGHPGPCHADHIGPISLGFTHRPKFQLLCSQCNSSKNNRMTYNDIKILNTDERNGECVVSWHTKPAWDLVKTKIKDDHDALKASKLLRDFSYYPLEIFYHLLKEGKIAFLVYLLDLKYADWNVEFKDLEVIDSITSFKEIAKVPRNTKFAKIQKARRVRIALTHITDFYQKENRHVYRPEGWSEESLMEIINAVKNKLHSTEGYDNQYLKLLEEVGINNLNAGNFHRIEKIINASDIPNLQFQEATDCISNYLSNIATQLDLLWDSDRYNR